MYKAAMQSLNFICQVLLVVCLTWSQAKSTAANNSEHYQITWNLLLDLQTVIFNSSELQQPCDFETLLDVNSTVEGILARICSLMEVQGLTEKAENASAMNALFRENLLNSCVWLNYVIDVSSNVSVRLRSIDDSCRVGYTPRLRWYCLEKRRRDMASFTSNIYHTLLRPISAYAQNLFIASNL